MKRRRERTSGSRWGSYRGRTKDQVRSSAEESGGAFDSYIKSGIDTFTPKDGSNRIRICPPTWKGYKDFAFDVWVHYRVGPDEQSYLCLSKMKGKPCPLCEERMKASKRGEDKDYISSLQPKIRKAVWVINRKSSDGEQPELWTMPPGVHREINELSIDEETGECIFVEDPMEGFDIKFKKQGKGIRTNYSGLQIERNSTPLTSDEDLLEEWKDFLVKHPIPDCLRYYSYEHIANVFGGKVSTSEDENDRPKRSKRPKYEDEDDRPKRPRRSMYREDDESEDEYLERLQDLEYEDDDDEDAPW